MADPRDTARAWLVDRLGEMLTGFNPGQVGVLADAVLSADGVEVDVERLTRRPGVTAHEGTFGWPATHTQVVIRLPAQPIKEQAHG